MKSALMIAYWFPPEGNAAVYRPLRFARNLPAFGWSASVISGDSRFERYDPELARQIPDQTEVIRVADQDLWQALQHRRGLRLQPQASGSSSAGAASKPPDGRASLRAQLRSLVRKAESWWYHPDMQKPWIRPAVDAAVAACERSHPDILWATGPPFSAFIIAQRVSQRTGVPYVLDFRTSWTIVPSSFEAVRPRWAQARDRRTLRQLLRGAQAVTFFYAAEAECFWRMYAGTLDVGRVHVIPNGFDGDVEPFVPAENSKLTILYTGTLSDYRYDTFLDALARFKEIDPLRVQRLSVRFVGEQEPLLLARVNELNLADVVSVQPTLPYDEIAARQRGADVLLMLERKPSHKGYELLAGAKLFNYLKAGRPIFGVVPEGEAAKILRDVGARGVADAGSVDAICAMLEMMFAAWSAGSLSRFVPDPTACQRYSAAAQTASLVRALDGRPALQPFVPGAVDVVPSLRAEFAAQGWA